MPSAFKTFGLVSYFVGFCFRELCEIEGTYVECEEKCCIGTTNYCCESEEMSPQSLVAIVFGCVAVLIILILCCIHINKARSTYENQSSGTNTTQPFTVEGHCRAYPAQTHPGQGQPYQGQGRQSVTQVDQNCGQQYNMQAQPRSTKPSNSTESGSCISDLPPSYSEVVGSGAYMYDPQNAPSAPEDGCILDIPCMAPQNSQVLYTNLVTNSPGNFSTGESSHLDNYGIEGIPERTNLNPSAP